MGIGKSSNGVLDIPLKYKPKLTLKERKLVKGSLQFSYAKGKSSQRKNFGFLNLKIFEARGLAKADLLGQSDPICIVKWNDKEVGRTVACYNTLNPIWEKEEFNITLNGDPNESTLSIECYDVDDDQPSEFLGKVSFTSEELFE